MAGHERDSRGTLALASSSSGGRGRGRAPEQERWAWSPSPSPAWSRPLSDSGRSSRAARSTSSSLASLFRSIGVWFSSLSTASSSASSSSSSFSKRRTKQAGGAAPADGVIKKPPLPGYTGKPSARGLYGGSGRQQRPPALLQFQSSVFSMEQILRATSNFSPALKIGQGGFGAVYKGVLPDGTAVAVKRAKLRMQNPHVDVEFRSEVKIMARIEHQSLVRFYGYMECGEERIVVVEYVPNGTLREHLDRCDGRFLDLGTRLDIAIDVAHAVTYLHMYSDHPIIHRDIKSSNILLTDSLRAKVADFGFARLGAGLGGDGGASHVTTQVKGTAGYLDPEYLKTCTLTDRSDVYSFGVLLVELASARRPIETKREMKERLSARWAMSRFISGCAADVLDPHLARTPAADRALEALLELAFRCMGPVRQDRPAMSDCCRALWAIRKAYRDMLADDVAPPTPQFSNRASTAAGSSGDGDLWRI